MHRCPHCSHETSIEFRFCPGCGAACRAEDADRTRTSLGARGRATPGTRANGERFLPGDLLAGRYRIIGPLGRGGMGEVYRADDLKLGQPVALKFLPFELERDPARLERLLREVRIARQISHPNVCRVYDVGEVEERHFLSMEFVDGEDLASLLRRIGRLPGDKAVELARQICAGLGAAHDQEILHRDLKPANVMIDGRGRAKVTDFGLAAGAGDVRGDEVFAGTPKYMAPEQRAGTAVTVRSDLYSLGLVLYEMFTGKEAFAASSLAELERLQRGTTPTGPSSLVGDVDPAVERVILRCLELDPADRPASALAIALSLPGGDPLAAALAAGETPSPEMVAAAGGEGALAPRAAAAWVVATIAGTIAFGMLYARTNLLAYAPVEKPPEVLVERAREVVRGFGYPELAADEAYGYFRNADVLRWISAVDPDQKRWNRLSEHRPPAVLFWYRQSPRPLVASSGSGSVEFFDPPPVVSGMTWVQTDPRGRLGHFLAAPPQLDEATGPAGEPDWSSVFSAAGLALGSFSPVDPHWVPLLYADTRRAWSGEFPERPGVPIRVEAAAYRGRVTYVSVLGPWARPGRMTPFEEAQGRRIGSTLYLTLTIAAVAIAVVLARRNVRSGRGDRRGAFRLAAYLLALQLLVWLLTAHHVAAFGEQWRLFEGAAASALYSAALAWVVYLALEPFVRRLWPESIIGWTRLLAGRIRDPRVGREILIGAALGIALAAALQSYHLAAQATGAPFPAPGFSAFDLLLGPRNVAGVLLRAHLASMNFGMFMFFFLFMGLAWGRKRWIGVAAFVGISAFMTFLLLGPGPVALKCVIGAAWAVLVAAMFLRAGLLGAMVGLLIGNESLPLFLNASVWYAGASLAIWSALATLVIYGFRIALGRRMASVTWAPPASKQRGG